MTAYVTPEQKAALDELTRRTRVPTSVYMREAVDDLLRKYAGETRSSARKGDE